MIRFRCFAFDSLRPPPPPRPTHLFHPRFLPHPLPLARVVFNPRIVCSLFIYRFNEYIREKALQNTRTGRYRATPFPLPDHPYIYMYIYIVFSLLISFLRRISRDAPAISRIAIFRSLIPLSRAAIFIPPGLVVGNLLGYLNRSLSTNVIAFRPTRNGTERGFGGGG